jgi:hypothetical protein
MQSLYAYGRAFDVVLIAAGAVAVLAAVVAVASCVFPGQLERWRDWRADRRYVRAGMRDLERYLTRAATTPARRPKGPPGSGRLPGSGT